MLFKNSIKIFQVKHRIGIN